METEVNYNHNITEMPTKSALVFGDPDAPENRKYTLFLFFIEGHHEEKTFEFVTGQATVREYVVENADIIDFEKSLISSWKEKPEGKNGFIMLYDFMCYLEKLTYEIEETGEVGKLYDDGFDMKEYLENQHAIVGLGMEEMHNAMNDIRLAYRRTEMIDIHRIEEGEDE